MSAQQPGHPPREGDPDLLAQPVETRVPADGRHAVAHLPMVTPTTDTTLGAGGPRPAPGAGFTAETLPAHPVTDLSW